MAQARLPFSDPTGLSELEARCLRLYGAGWSRDEISRLARVSRRTVGAALTVAKEKLGARTLAHAALLLSGLTPELGFVRDLPL
jgi:DNA-binding CsgD family transcriptional regulator